MSLVAPTLEMFFTDRLAKQRQASPATIRSYRNAIVLLLRFIQDRTGKAPSALDWEDLGAEAITAFLDHLEADRANGARSRNARLAAIRSLYRFAALRHPEHAQLIAQVLAVPQKRSDKRLVSFLEENEVEALLRGCRVILCSALRGRGLGEAAEQEPGVSGPYESFCDDRVAFIVDL